MDTYSTLRELADSWALLVLTLIFLGVIAFAWRPGSRALHEDAGRVPFRHDDAPADAPPPAAAPAPARAAPRLAGCANACADCTCASSLEKDARHG